MLTFSRREGQSGAQQTWPTSLGAVGSASPSGTPGRTPIRSGTSNAFRPSTPKTLMLASRAWCAPSPTMASGAPTWGCTEARQLPYAAAPIGWQSAPQTVITVAMHRRPLTLPALHAACSTVNCANVWVTTPPPTRSGMRLGAGKWSAPLAWITSRSAPSSPLTAAVAVPRGRYLPLPMALGAAAPAPASCHITWCGWPEPSSNCPEPLYWIS